MSATPTTGQHEAMAALEAQIATREDLLQPLPDFKADNSDAEAAYHTGHALGRMTWEAYQQRYNATHDALTGLPNRTLFTERLNACAAERPGQFSLLFLDLDGLKVMNDKYGHAAGDLMIKQAAEILNQVLRTDSQDRPSDLLARLPVRLAGDELAALLPDVENQEDLDKIVERIETTMRAEGLSISIGGRTHKAGESGEELLAAADKLMYTKKLERKDEQHRQLPRRKRVAGRIARTLGKYAGLSIR